MKKVERIEKKPVDGEYIYTQRAAAPAGDGTAGAAATAWLGEGHLDCGFDPSTINVSWPRQTINTASLC